MTALMLVLGVWGSYRLAEQTGVSLGELPANKWAIWGVIALCWMSFLGLAFAAAFWIVMNQLHSRHLKHCQEHHAATVEGAV